MKLNELAGNLTDKLTQIDRGIGEIKAQIADLKNQLANVEIPADAQAALDALSIKAQEVDDLSNPIA